MDASQQNREVEIKTPLGKDVLLLQNMDLTEEMGRLFTIDLELSSTIENITFEDLLGQNVTIRLDTKSNGKRFFNGYVSKFSQSVNSGSFSVYQATVRPWLWFLTRTSDCRIFQEMTVPDIIKQVFRDLGFTDFEEKLSAPYRMWGYCVQYRETDFNFISRLMEQEGIYYYFKHEDGKHTLILSDSYSAHESIPGYASIPYYQADGSTVRKDEHVSRWYVSKEVQPGVYALNEFDFEKPKASLDASSSVARPHSKSEYEVYDYPGEYLETIDGDRYARTRIEEMHAQYEQLQAGSDARGMMSGGLFSLLEYPREDQNREYLVTQATHTVHVDAYESSGGGGGFSYSNSFLAIDSSTPFHSARITPKPIVQGTQTAIVVGPSGEEIYTDEYGRVKLQFHWDRYGKSDENSSCWVRVAQIWAGKNWGGIHIPRIGQEVIVDFMEGDPDRPIITGRVYNADQMPPYDLPNNKTQSGMKSRSSKGGSTANFNEIRFEDKKGKEQVYIHAEKNQDNIVENNETTQVGHDRTEDVKHDEKITIDHDRTEKVGHNEDITIGNNRTETVGANEKISIGGKRTETVAGKEDLTITGQRVLKVMQGEQRLIVGDQLQTITGTQTEMINGSLMQISMGGATIFTPATYTVVASGGYTLIAPSSDSIFKANDVAVVGNKMEAVGLVNSATGVKNEVVGMAVVHTGVNMSTTGVHLDNPGVDISNGVTKIVNRAISIFT